MLRLVRFILGVGNSGSTAVNVAGVKPTLVLSFTNQSYEVNS